MEVVVSDKLSLREAFECSLTADPKKELKDLTRAFKQSQSAEERRSIIFQAACFGDRASSLIAAALLKDKSPYVKQVAAKIARLIPTKKIFKALFKAYGDPRCAGAKKEVVKTIIALRKEIAEVLPKFLRQAFNEDYDSVIRAIKIVEACGEYATPCIPMLIELGSRRLSSNGVEDRIQSTAMQVAERIDYTKTAEIIAKKLASTGVFIRQANKLSSPLSGWKLRSQEIVALCKRQNKFNLVFSGLRLLGQGKFELAKEIRKQIEKTEDPEDLACLYLALEVTGEEVDFDKIGRQLRAGRKQASTFFILGMDFLVLAPEASAVPKFLVSQLDKVDHGVKLNLIDVIGYMGDRAGGVVPDLLPYVKDHRYPDQQIACVRALANIGDSSSSSAFTDLLNDKQTDFYVKVELRRAVKMEVSTDDRDEGMLLEVA